MRLGYLMALLPSVVFSLPVMAQDVAAPPAAALVAPAVTGQSSSFEGFPDLPPSRPCTQKELQRYWHLQKVYEVPQGTYTRDFTARPHQYIHFGKDTTYRMVKMEKRVGRKAFYKQFARKAGDPLQQYVVHDKGFVYFYNEGNVIDTQACFIVAEASGDFKKGFMLLMPPAPPAGQPVTQRVLRLYEGFVKKNPKKKRKKKSNKKRK
ncbi:MAG: hypothetical protein ACN2B6_02650 [Rickettsiales bacterium]